MPTSAPDLILDAEGCRPAADLAVNPFVANRYHFGMLLGVDDLETEQGYHRGKTWLHSAWLHGAGVVCGLRVVLRPSRRELAVLPGLALDPAGRELALDREHCLDLGRWFDEEAPDDLVVDDSDPALIRFTVHVTVAAHSCTDRPVPAVSEPCAGVEVDTADSRTVETAVLDLRAGPAPDPEPPPYRRLRELFGILATTDDEVVAALAELSGSSPSALPGDLLAWFRRFAADDVMDLPHHPDLFPHEPGQPVVLAQVEVVLRRTDGQLELVGDGTPAEGDGPTSRLDNRVRPSHVATSTIQELLCGPAVAGGAVVPEPPDEPDAGEPSGDGDGPGGDAGPGGGAGPGPPGPGVEEGPRIDPDSVALSGRDLTLRSTAPLRDRSVRAAAFEVTVLQSSGWRGVNINNAKLSEHDDQQIEIRLNSAPSARPMRVLVRGTGRNPVVGTDLRPIAGLVGGPPGSIHDGNDAAVMIHD